MVRRDAVLGFGLVVVFPFVQRLVQMGPDEGVVVIVHVGDALTRLFM